jgi:hypothetical protein
MELNKKHRNNKFSKIETQKELIVLAAEDNFFRLKLKEAMVTFAVSLLYRDCK